MENKEKKEKKKRRNGTYSTKAVLNAKFLKWNAQGDLKAILGDVEGKGFSVHVYGESSQGKSTLVARLLIALCEYGKVYFNNTESGFSSVIQKMAIQTGMTEDMPIYWGDNHSIVEMIDICSKNRARIIALDSVQDAEMNYAQFKTMLKKFKNRVIVTIGWADGKNPKGEDAKAIKYKSDVKIRVHEGVAYVKGRFGSVAPYRIPGVFEHFQRMKAEEKAIKDGLSPSAVELERERKLNTPQ